MTVCKAFPLVIVLLSFAAVFPGETVQGETKIKYLRTVESYVVPDVTLLNQDGKKVRLQALLNSDKPVLVDFIFTSCTTIGPLLSIRFRDFQSKLGLEADRVRLVSISTAPEKDTPQALKSYLQRYHAITGWDFLTGRGEDIDTVLKAFRVYSPNKVSHPPVILLKSPSENRWVRVSGPIEIRDLIREYQKVLTPN